MNLLRKNSVPFMSKKEYKKLSENAEGGEKKQTLFVEELEKDNTNLKQEVHRLKAVTAILCILLFNIGIFINHKFPNWAVIGIIIFEMVVLFVYAKGNKNYNYLVTFIKDIITKQDKKK